MCTTTFAALLGLAVGCHAGAPAALLAPLDPRVGTRWHPPPSPMAGLKRIVPVEARGAGPAARPMPPGGGMPSMPGKYMPGKYMPDESMPGMSMPGMGGR